MARFALGESHSRDKWSRLWSGHRVYVRNVVSARQTVRRSLGRAEMRGVLSNSGRREASKSTHRGPAVPFSLGECRCCDRCKEPLTSSRPHQTHWTVNRVNLDGNFIIYENWTNRGLAIHREGCSQLAKHGGVLRHIFAQQLALRRFGTVR